MNLEEKTLSTKEIYNGKILKLRVDTVILPNGKTAFREEVSHSGGSGVLCEQNDNIIFVSQYRKAFEKVMLEIPAGKKEPHESFEEAAERELIEEIGLKAKKLIPIGRFCPSPGYTNEVFALFYANEFDVLSQHLDSDEFLNIVKIPKLKAFKMLDSGEITDAKTVIALFYLKASGMA